MKYLGIKIKETAAANQGGAMESNGASRENKFFSAYLMMMVICGSLLCITPMAAQELSADSSHVFNPDGIELIFVEGTGVGITEIHSFYIGKFPVTQAQWRAVMGNNPSRFGGRNLPVERVSWHDAQEFISNLNARTGRNYRLPTSTEWGFAARGGTASRGYEFSGSNNIDDVGWYRRNSRRRTQNVGTKQPNELGIYDMTGNVWEWSQDLSDRSNRHRTLRGGSWYSNANNCRVAVLYNTDPNQRLDNIGFRVVLPINEEYVDIDAVGDENEKPVVVASIQQVQRNVPVSTNVQQAGNMAFGGNIVFGTGSILGENYWLKKSLRCYEK